MLRILENDNTLRIVQVVLGFSALLVVAVLGGREYALGTLADVKPELGALAIASACLIFAGMYDNGISPEERA